MKISSYYKNNGNNITLKTDYEDLEIFDKVFVSKVFSETKVPESVLSMNNVEYGGSGFFYDKAPFLPYHIEHSKPDYSLYDIWVKSQIESGKKALDFEYYKDYSIGFTTRGCIRGCDFCINKNYKKVFKHSPLDEFYDDSKKYICLLDDNILAYPNWMDIFTELNNKKKPFQYKQGMDERLLNKEKVNMLVNSKYKGDYIFAFDNVEDKDIIINKLILWREYCKKTTKFYVFCGFDRNNNWDDTFWVKDIEDVFERVNVLMKFGSLPYIMRYKRYKDSPYKGMYITVARWCNQPNFYKKKSFREFCEANQRIHKNENTNCATYQYMLDFEKNIPI